jgi:molybdate transport system substrate-binding protein
LKYRNVHIVFILGLVLSACSPALAGTVIPSVNSVNSMPTSVPAVLAREGQPRILTVYAAASLTDAFQEISTLFEALHPGIVVRFNFAGSQILRTQLEQGAIADIFASADHKNMQLLESETLVALGSSQNFATNNLIVILPGDNPAHIDSLHDLVKPGIKLVLADESVPAGNYSLQLLSNLSKSPANGADFKSLVLGNVVSHETDVRQVVAKVELGEADAGIVYSSDAIATPGLITIAIPTEYNITAEYPIAQLAHAANPDLAAEFIEFITSDIGQAIMTRWGFFSGN